MKKVLFIFLFTVAAGNIFAQAASDSVITKAYQNARRGVYWALANIPDRKLRFSHDLITGDNLTATVKLEVEINGIKIMSTGYENSAEVSITLYKSVENLRKEGYLKNKSVRQPGED